MANKNNNDEITKEIENLKKDKSFKRMMNNISNVIGQANLSLYGTDRNSEIDDLNAKFQSIMDKEVGELNNHNSEDVTSFLGKIVSSDSKSSAMDEIVANQFMAITNNDDSTLQSFIYDAYRNRFLEQSDLHEVAAQLIELGEAINITRDAIINTDIVEGKISRSLVFDNIDDEDVNKYTSIIENLEKKFNTREDIKDFIVPKTLEYGEYYKYTIPYSKLFSDFQKQKEREGYGGRLYRETTLTESFDEENKNSKQSKNENNNLDLFIESTYEKYTKDNNNIKKDPSFKNEFKKDMTNILENVSVCNDPIPLPVIEEGISSFEYLKTYVESQQTMTEKDDASKPVNLFDQVVSSNGSEGITLDKGHTKKENDFSEFTDCYIKNISPVRLIPVKILSTTIGYYYVQDEDTQPLDGAVSSNLYYSRFDNHRHETTIIDSIAERVVKSFNKDFLKDNSKFKSAIVDCINYYNLNEKKLKFQFIPVEYIQEFKIDKDEDGNGQSMIKKSLFYAKLYLMLLLFKVMTIILNSNDTKVNYLKQSGIDKDIANKVQEIARMKQNKQVNIQDLFSYTTLINKVGNGNEMYIPVGRSGDKPIETEILAGQEVQLNTELLEMLKNAYILGTGVPAAIMNYMNEADYAKTVDQNNTKFNARVISYQIDFNASITEYYKKLMRYSSSNIPENIIENFKFVLQLPKTALINTKVELINNFESLASFMIQLFYDDPSQAVDGAELTEKIKIFKREFAKQQLPSLKIDEIEELVKDVEIRYMKEKLKPKASNGDSGDDMGLDEEI